MKNTSRLALVLSLMILTSCGLSSKLSERRVKKHYEVFYRGDAGTTYFIKPLEFESESDKLEIDYTYTHASDRTDLVSVKFSIWSPEKIKAIDSLEWIGSSKQSFTMNQPTRMFLEKAPNGFIARFEGYVSYPLIDSLFQNHEYSIRIYHEQTNIHFDPTPSTRKLIPLLDSYIWDLIR